MFESAGILNDDSELIYTQKIGDHSDSQIGIVNRIHHQLISKGAHLLPTKEPFNFGLSKTRGFNPNFSEGRVLRSDRQFLIEIDSAEMGACDTNQFRSEPSRRDWESSTVKYTVSVQNKSETAIEYMIITAESRGNILVDLSENEYSRK